jgi:hypothetical protein
MIIAAIVLVLAAGSSDPIATVDPGYPPNAVGGGTVVATLDVVNGSVTRVDMISGAEPFASSARAALAAWQFPPSPETEQVSVVVDFVPPGINAVGSEERRLAQPPEGSPGPYPQTILEPQYPPDGTGQGAVILAVDLDAKGDVDEVGVVRDLGAFTRAGIQAVRKWLFSPARDSSGDKRPSRVYAVLVFRAPVL